MKYFLTLPLLFLYVIVIAQVPPTQEVRGDISYDNIVMPKSVQLVNQGNEGAGYYQKDGKYGFVFPAGVKQEAVYNRITSGSNGFLIQKGNLFGLADKKGGIIGEIEYDSVGTIYQSVYIVKKNGKYGTISDQGNKILSIKYDRILFANSFVSFVQAKNGQVEMIFNEQEKTFSSKIELADVYANLVVIKTNGRYGIVKKQVLVPFEYDSIFVSSAETNVNTSKVKKTITRNSPIDKSNYYKMITVLTIQKDNKYGLIDSDGSVIYTTDNDAVYNQENYKYYTVKKGNLYGIYFTAGKKKTGIEFDKVYVDGIGNVMAVKNQKAGIFDLQGKQIVAFEYDPEFIMQYRIGFRISKNKKRGIVGKDGKVLVPPIYDDVDPFYESGLTEFVKVKSNGKFGVVNLKGEVIVPVEFEWIGQEKGFLKAVIPDKRFGLYDQTGKVVVPAVYQWINNSETENSNVIVLKKDDKSYNFLNKNTRQLLLKENVSSYGYVHDQDGLLNPFVSTGKPLLFVKDKNGKVGLLNEITGALDVPMIYDEVIQRFDEGKSTYFSVRIGKKYGLINGANRQVIPLQYDQISINLMAPDYGGQPIHPYTVVVAKGNKFGAVNLDNQVMVPFKYDDLQRVSPTALYKAKVAGHYQIINARNEIINKGPFDEVANFEGVEGRGYRSAARLQALTFYKGKMRVVDEKGSFVAAEVAMQPHVGYKTFDELKFALLNALTSKDDVLLKDFSDKIAPSEHLLFYLKENPFSKKTLQFTDVNSVKEKYYNDLLQFKHGYWNQDSGHGYTRGSLTQIPDYTLNDNGFVTNKRTADHAFGDTRFMEKLLRNAFKINGYWISSYFMLRNFDRY